MTITTTRTRRSRSRSSSSAPPPAGSSRSCPRSRTSGSAFGHRNGGGGALSFDAITGTAYLALTAGKLIWANALGSAAVASAACSDRTADASCYEPWLWAGAAGFFLAASPPVTTPPSCRVFFSLLLCFFYIIWTPEWLINLVIILLFEANS